MISDANGNPIDCPSRIVFADASDPVKNSPATALASKVILKPPTGAAICKLRTDQTGVFVSDTADGSNGKYPVTANLDCEYPCANGKLIYVLIASGDVYYKFEMI